MKLVVRYAFVLKLLFFEGSVRQYYVYRSFAYCFFVQADAIVLRAKARAEGIKQVSETLVKNNGIDAATLIVAEKYVAALSNIAKETNTVVVPSNLADAGSLISQSLAIYKQLSGKKLPPVSSQFEPIGKIIRNELMFL